MIDYKWLADIDYISGSDFNWIDTFVYTGKAERGLDGIYVRRKETLSIFYGSSADSLLSWTYSVLGRRAYYRIEGYAVKRADVLDCYATKLSDGVYLYGSEKINKKEPFFRLRYYKGQIQTQWLQPAPQKTFHVYFRHKGI